MRFTIALIGVVAFVSLGALAAPPPPPPATPYPPPPPVTHSPPPSITPTPTVPVPESTTTTTTYYPTTTVYAPHWGQCGGFVASLPFSAVVAYEATGEDGLAQRFAFLRIRASMLMSGTPR